MTDGANNGTQGVRATFVQRVEEYSEHVKMSPDKLYRLASNTQSRGLFKRIKEGANVTLSVVETWERLMDRYPDGPPDLLS